MADGIRAGHETTPLLATGFGWSSRRVRRRGRVPGSNREPTSPAEIPAEIPAFARIILASE